MNCSRETILREFDEFISITAAKIVNCDLLEKANEDLQREVKLLLGEQVRSSQLVRKLSTELHRKDGELVEMRRQEAAKIEDGCKQSKAIAEASKLLYEVESLTTKLRQMEGNINILKGENERLLRANQAIIREQNNAKLLLAQQDSQFRPRPSSGGSHMQH